MTQASEGKGKGKGFSLPILQGILPIDRAGVGRDVIAGFTLAALSIPGTMGYTKIIGTPVITGLYTILIPMSLFAIFGSSRHLSVNADSATAAVVAAALAGMAVRGSDEWLALCSLIALMAGAFMFLARVMRLGFLADFLSRTVLTGFLTGVGVQVSLLEVSGLLGVHSTGNHPLTEILHDVRSLGETNPYAVAVSLAVLLIIVGGRKISQKIPGGLIAVLAAIAASWALNLGAHLETLGAVPSGLPTLGLPQLDWSWPLIWKLLPIALACFVVILAQSAATSRAYAARFDDRFDENVDMVGLGMANLGAGLSGTFIVNGSPTNTEMVASGGGRSQVSQLTTSAIVLLVLLFLTGPLAYLPAAVLSAIVFLVAVKMIDIQGMRRIYSEARAEFWVALLTAATVVVVGVEQGIVLAMVLSLLDHVRRGYRGNNTVIAADKRKKGWQMVPLNPAQQIAPGLLVYCFSHSLYYANCAQFSEEVLGLAKTRAPAPLDCLCVEAAAIGDVDFSAAAMLRSVCLLLREQGIRLVFANVSPALHAQFDRHGLTELLGANAIYGSVHAVIVDHEEKVAAAAATTAIDSGESGESDKSDDRART
ncbi:SulP family inorganic anion transporter [Candidatus Accumulibacter phosphatis]|uniref:SulP family inorganic anion transporter n=1 Tax=Candidatus Accumulibacter phosphatis TaxID=327160 RepID=A0ABX1TRZ0_9PROT|nr:SulP family inorganic anion transporter [Candidatus Accumulibacter phosphatis]NMQ26996.1 SulP family inorganic anion transporter [Candidatus Accumulibacter phosphatis]